MLDSVAALYRLQTEDDALQHLRRPLVAGPAGQASPALGRQQAAPVGGGAACCKHHSAQGTAPEDLALTLALRKLPTSQQKAFVGLNG